MKLAVAATLVASAAAFAPSAPVISRASSLSYSIHVINEDEGIDATFECDEETFLVGESLLSCVDTACVDTACRYYSILVVVAMFKETIMVLFHVYKEH